MSKQPVVKLICDRCDKIHYLEESGPESLTPDGWLYIVMYPKYGDTQELHLCPLCNSNLSVFMEAGVRSE